MIDDHPSVSMAALDMLYIMGCNPIIIIGQDLSFKDNRNYADANADTLTEHQKNSAIPDVDIYGNPVYTYNEYKTMQNELELLNIKYKNKVNIFNATEGGLNIYGMENVKFIDVYKKYIAQRPYDVGDRIDKIVSMTNNERTMHNTVENNDNISLMNDFFGHLLLECEKVDNVVRQKESGFTQLAKLIDRGVSNNRINNEMLNIQSYNNLLVDIDFYKDVVHPNIEPSLAFFKAGSKHIADGGADWEGALLYEKKLDEFAINYTNVLKTILLKEIIGDAASFTNTA
jgi:hypothetical protein